MAKSKKIIWSLQAQIDRLHILEFWHEHNQLVAYSEKLNTLFINNLEIAACYPHIGKKTDIKNVRSLIIKEFLIFYEIFSDRIDVLRIWDNRQDPSKLRIIR